MNVDVHATRRSVLRAGTLVPVPAALAGAAYEPGTTLPKPVAGSSAKGEVTFLDWEASLEGLPTETVLLKRDKIRREVFYEFIYDSPANEGKYWAQSTGNQPACCT